MKLNRYQGVGLFLLVLLVAIEGGVAVGVHVVQRDIPSSGKVLSINVECYWDAACTQVVTEIDWGNRWPGDVETSQFYVLNDGNTELTLIMVVRNWIPYDADAYLSITWDAEGEVLAGGDKRFVILTLTVSEDITGIDGFSCNIIVEGTSPL